MAKNPDVDVSPSCANSESENMSFPKTFDNKSEENGKELVCHTNKSDTNPI